jgi:hypothetical protein
MKTKKFSKRLNLNKKTVADLNGNEMNDAVGGISGLRACFTYDLTCGENSCGPGASNCYSDNGVGCICL